MRDASWTSVPTVLILLLSGCVQYRDASLPPSTPSLPPPLYAADCSMANWVDPCIFKTSPNPSKSKTEIDLVVNPLDPDNVVLASKDLDAQASNCVWSVAYVTKDAGQTWTASYVGKKKSERTPSDVLYAWSCVTDPIMAFDKGGWLFYGVQAYNALIPGSNPPAPLDAHTTGSGFYLARSKDGGTTWDRIIPLHVGDGSTVFHDYPRMASNPVTGSTFVIWNQINSLPAGGGFVEPVIAGTRDRGETPTTPVYLVAQTDPNRGEYGINGFAASKKGAQGTLYITLTTTKDAKTDEAWLIQSADDGRTWTAPAKIFEYTRMTPAPGGGRAHTPTTMFRAGSSVELAVDATDGPGAGCLYANWADNGTGSTKILNRRSCDQGKTWSDAVRVSNTTSAAYELFQRPTVSADGVLHIGYVTQAYDPGLRLLDAEYAYSEDGGETWRVQRLTNTSFDGDKGIHQDGPPFYGDYNGIGASGDHVWFGFPDTAEGVAEVAAAHLVKRSPSNATA